MSCCNSRFFSSFSLKPYNYNNYYNYTSISSTGLRPFQHSIGSRSRRSRRRRSCFGVRVLAAQSDVVLIATTEHEDGSFLYRFGDASDLPPLVETQPQQASQVLLDGDQQEDTQGHADGDDDDDDSQVAAASDHTNSEKQLLLSQSADEEDTSQHPSLSFHLQTMQIGAMDDFETTKTDTPPSAFSLTMPDAAANKMPPSIPLDAHPVNQQDIKIHDELMSSAHQLPLVTQLQSLEDEFTTNTHEEEEPEIIVEDELIQPQSAPLQLDPSDCVKPETIQVSDTDARQPYTEDESDMVETIVTTEGDLLPPASMHVSDVDMLQHTDINSEPALIDGMLISDPLGPQPTLQIPTTKGMDVKDADMDEKLQPMNVSEDTFIDEIAVSNPLGAEPSLQVLTTVSMVVKDVDMEESLQPMNVSEGTSIDEMPTSDLLGVEPSLEISTTKGMDVTATDMDERLQDMSINEDTFIVEMPTSDPLGVEPSLEISTLQGMDVKAADMDEKLQDMSISEDTSIVEMPTSVPLIVEPTLEVSTTKGMDVKDVDMEEGLQPMNVSEGNFIDEMTTSDPLVAEATLEVLITEGMDVKNLAVEDELQLVSNHIMDENESADVTPAEPLLEEEVSQPHLTPVELKATVQVSDINVEDADGQNLDDGILQVIDEDAGDSYIHDLEKSSHQLESQPVQDERVKQNMLEQCSEPDAVESSILLQHGTHDPLLEAERTEGVVGTSELAEASEVTALLLVEREETYLTDDFLLSGAALLEHPIKALTGGDDAYFVADSKWLGVANGVSRWSFEGTDPGIYAQELMRTCEEIVLNTSSLPVTNPVELLCRGIKETTMPGSANVLIAKFNDQTLHVANVGDTGFLIIRHGAIYKKSYPLLHGFHFALQIEDSDDPLELVEEHVIELEVGDIVVSATDGLFDNLYEREITIIVSKSLQAGMKPQEIANILATRAQEVGKSAFVRSPFSDAAQAAGYTGYAGGKPDHVAVIVSLV